MSPAGPGLGDPRVGDCGDPAGGDDPVVEGVPDPSVGAIDARQEWVMAQAGQPGAGSVDEFGVDVDGADVALAEPVAEQGGVVAGAGADLQHPVTGLRV